MSTFNEWPHLPEEKCEEQRPDMATIHVRITHQDDLVIADLVKVVFLAYSCTDSRDQGLHLGVLEHLV